LAEQVYLLDTTVVFELRRSKPHGAVVAWLGGVADEHLHLCAVTVGEIQAGIEVTRTQDAAKADEIEAWLARVMDTYSILAMDARAFRCWARLMHRCSEDVIGDAMIAAIAIVHDLVVVTRTGRNFGQFGVRTLDPFMAGA
jgi:predicted nucleic acid-binding protein